MVLQKYLWPVSPLAWGAMEALGEEPVSTPVDGRLARSERSRRAIIAAYADLLAAGERSPRPEQVAQRAGVGIRTVFYRFNDLEALREQVAAEVFVRVAPLQLTPDDLEPGATLDVRLDLYVTRRAAVLEMIDPYARSVQGRHGGSEALTGNRVDLVRGSLHELSLVFAAELRTTPDDDRTALLHSLHMVSAWPAWATLRDELGLSPAEVRATLRTALRRLLTAPSPPEEHNDGELRALSVVADPPD